MAFTRIGLGAELRVNEQPMVHGMDRARDATGRFIQGTQRVGPEAGKAEKKTVSAFERITKGLRRAQAGLDKFSGAMRSLALAAAPAGLAMYKGVKAAADFEQAMADLGAVSRASAEDMGRLSVKAKEMGIVTAFSASESANAMEQLARAGATVDEQIGGVKGILDLAAAGNVQYARSAEIVANITRAMGREFSKTSNLADILAFAASKSNVTVETLGEAFRYGAPQAHTMGIKTEQLVAIFGKLGDAGLKGSIAGTSMTNMLVRLSKPSREAQKIMKRFHIELTDGQGKLRQMADIVEDFKKALDTETNMVERARMMTELFGIRGQKAYAALATAGGKALKELEEGALRASDGIGVAGEMAERRLDTLKGSLKMLGASIEGLSIEIFTGVGEGMKTFVQEATGGLNKVLHTLDILKAAGTDQVKQQQAIADATKKYGETATSVALGIMDAIQFMKDAWNSVTEGVKNFGRSLESVIGKKGVRALIGLIGKILMLAAVMIPVSLGLAGIAFIISKVLIPATLMFGRVLRGVFSKWGIVLFLAAKLIMKVSDKANDASRGVRRISEYTHQSVRNDSAMTTNSVTADYNRMSASISRNAAKGSAAMKTTMVNSLNAQERQAVSMAQGVGKSYGDIVNAAQSAATRTGTAWSESATQTKENWKQASKEMIVANTGLAKAFGDTIDLVAEGATIFAEFLGFQTERTKYNAYLAKRAMEIEKKRQRVEFRYGAIAKEMGYKSGRAYLAAKKEKEARRKATKDELRFAFKERKDVSTRFDKWAAEKRRKKEEFLAGFAKLGAREQARILKLQAEGKLGEFELTVNNRVCIDGKDVSWAVTKQQRSIQQRAAAKSTPYQRKQVAHGALPGTVSVKAGA